MNTDLTGILISLGLFASVVLIIYFINSYRYKERIEMLKMGLTPPPRVGYLRGLPALCIACVSIAAGLALLLTLFFDYDPERVTWAIVSLFLGIGLFVYYKFTAPQREQKMRLQEEYIKTLTRQIDVSARDSDITSEIEIE